MPYTDHLQYFGFLHFDLAWDALPSQTCHRLGQCSQCLSLIAHSPLKPELASKMHTVALARYIQGTAAIEGRQLDTGTIEQAAKDSANPQAPASVDYSSTEIQNYLQVCHEVHERARQDPPPPITLDSLGEMNRRVLEDTQVAEGINRGYLRHHPVNVQGYVPPGPEHLPPLMSRYLHWLADDAGLCHADTDFLSPLERGILKAVVAHLYSELIHPYGDGNGRVGRLLELEFLLRAGVPYPSALALTSYYNTHKTEYYARLRQIELEPKDDTPFFAFFQFALDGLIEGAQEHLLDIQQQTLEALWRDYIHERFALNDHRKAAIRQRHLALALGEQPTLNRHILDLSPQVARDYATLSENTLSRDLKQLEKMGLAVTSKKGWAANIRIMLAFVPR